MSKLQSDRKCSKNCSGDNGLGTPGGRSVLEEGRVAMVLGAHGDTGAGGEFPLTSDVRYGVQQKWIRGWQGFWGVPWLR